MQYFKLITVTKKKKKKKKNLNLNSDTPNDIISPGGSDGGEIKSLERTSEANLDTQSSDISAVENRESGRSFQSLIVWGKKLYL